MRPLRPFGKDVTQLYDVIVKNGKIENGLVVSDAPTAEVLVTMV